MPLMWECISSMKVRSDPRVVLLEGVNARYRTPGQVGEDVDIATVDVSFISLKILPALVSILRRERARR